MARLSRRSSDREEPPAIPQTPDELTPAWYTTALGADGSAAEVVAIDHEAIGVGVGFMGEIYRSHLTWSDPHADLPSTVVTKVPSRLEKNRVLGEALLAYEREIRVYTELTDRLGVRLPTHLVSDMEPAPTPWLEPVIVFLLERLPVRAVGRLIDGLIKLATLNQRRYVLVMEDVDDARPPSQVEGGTLDDARLALQVLATFHGQNWEADDLVTANGWLWPVNRTPKVLQASYRRTREQFTARFGPLVGDRVIELIDDVHHRYPELVDELSSPPWCLLHGDYRLDNLLFRPDGEVVVLDWQLMGWGRPGWDVAYFMTTALQPEHRDEEDLLLRTYHEQLLATGIESYSLDDLRHDCDLTKRVLAYRLVTSDDFIDTAMTNGNGDGDDASLIEVMAGRLAGWLDV